MAIHATPTTMLMESLDESLEAAKFCVEYKKTDSKWGIYTTSGCLGYPAGILLFSLIDTIGSYHKKDPKFKVTIDGKQDAINADGWEHFKILNYKYFNQPLSREFLAALYTKFRSCLTHNSVLGKGTLMYPDNSVIPSIAGSNTAFALGEDKTGNEVYVIFMKELYHLCVAAVDEFKKDIDTIVPNSKQGKKFH